jgi:PAS domain S-box-containing protein
VEGLAAALTLTAAWTRPARLVSHLDLGRYSAACAIGGLVSACVFATTAALTSYGTPWKVGAAVLLSHTVSFALGLGLFAEGLAKTPYFSKTHRSLIWVATVAISVIACLPTTPALAFLVIPVLGWMAFNGRIVESVLQIIVIAVIVGTLTGQGYGPFAHPALSVAFSGEFQNVPLMTFLFACALVAIPLPISAALQRHSESEALRERNRSARLVESAHGTGIIETDQHGAITMFNPGAERIFGYSLEEVRGRTTEMFHSQEEITRKAAELGCEPTYAAIMGTLSSLDPGVARDWEVIRKDGLPRVVSVIVGPVSDEKGDFSGYVATADDVTERFETQAALEGALTTEREAVRRLTEVDRVKDRFVSSVSHELRTPITNIVGYLELLMDGVYGGHNDEQRHAMSRIETNSRRLLGLIDDLLTLSQMESAIRPELAPVDLVSVVRRSEEIVRPGLLRRDLQFDVEVPDHPVVVDGDAGQLERMVINLATNAVKFTLDGGQVTLRLIAPDSGAVIEVEDTGIGIPEADQEMLFSRFFRAAQAREAAVQGSGLGLSIAKSIAELHDARISVTSTFGSGSTFRVEFPSQVAGEPHR